MGKKQYSKPARQCLRFAADVVTTSGETMIGFKTEWIDDPSRTLGE